MLRVYSSNRTERLVAHLLGRVAMTRPENAFEPIEVVVPSAALRRYLTLATADTTGICANLQFDFLASWQWRMIRRVLPGVSETSPFAAPRLTWRIYRAFGDEALIQRHPRLHAYLSASDPAMRLELAMRTAGLFDQYVTYRQDWLARWRAGERIIGPADPARTGAESTSSEAGPDKGARLAADARADELWQADLWRWLNRDLGVGAVHPAEAFVRELERAGPKAARRFGLPEQAHLFALPDMAPLHRDLVIQLGRWMSLDLYLLDPCEAYWHDIESPRRIARLAARGRAEGVETGNRLLAAWGRQTQALVAGLASAADSVSGFDAFDSDTGFEPNPDDTLLARVQNAILELEEFVPDSIELDDGDRSLEVHVCHSLTRELEVVQDRLLGLFAANRGLTPGDVLVAVPDIDAAAPLVEAVFGTATDPWRIPFTITGRASRDSEGPTRALTSLLDLAMSRVTATALFALLQQPIIARRFDFDDEALERLHQWLIDAGFRWGLDASHRASFGVPAAQRHTLGDAIERLLLGYASPDAMLEPFADRIGVAGAEGADALTLGALWQFQAGLSRLRQDLIQPHRPADWGRIAQRALDDFLAPDRDDRAPLRELRETLANLVGDMIDGDVDEPVPFAAFRAALLRALAPSAPGGIPGGAVTFTSLAQLRAVPFRVVCLLGLDHGAFPKAVRPAEFDLMAQLPRPGDRQRRDDDRNLFLDLLLAAREVVHLSHCGRSVVDNAAQPPSAVVSELLEALRPALIGADRLRLVVEHPLQPFSAEALSIDADPRRRSHNRDYALALAQAARTGTALPGRSDSDRNPNEASDITNADAAGDSAQLLPVFVSTRVAPRPPKPEGGVDVETVRTIGLDDLVRFFRNPAEAFLRARLGIDLPRGRLTLGDDEPILPGSDERRSLASRLLPPLIAGTGAAALADLQALARAGGEWPEGLIGQTTLGTELAELEAFAGRVRLALHSGPRPTRSVDTVINVDGEPWRLRGVVEAGPGQGLLRWRYANRASTDLLELWIRHLGLLAGTAITTADVNTTADVSTTADVRTTAAAGATAAAGTGPAAITSCHLARDEDFRLRAPGDAVALLADLVRLYREGMAAPLPFYPKAAWQLVGLKESLAAVTRTWVGGPHQPWAESTDASVRLVRRGLAPGLDPAFFDCAHRVFEPLLAWQVDPADDVGRSAAGDVGRSAPAAEAAAAADAGPPAKSKPRSKAGSR